MKRPIENEYFVEENEFRNLKIDIVDAIESDSRYKEKKQVLDNNNILSISCNNKKLLMCC